MPSALFFRNLGLFVQENFLDPAICAQLCEEIERANLEKGTITGSGDSEGLLDEARRKVLSAKVEMATDSLVKERILAIKSSLEDHFQVAVARCQGPNFLKYEQGAFYSLHRDASQKAPSEVQARRISLVIFLNARTNQPKARSYGGGSLTFYGLMEGPEWGKCAFSLEADPGLLIAFRSDVLHEVRPVIFGQRFTIVSWFTAVE